jgi:hypothetical protein
VEGGNESLPKSLLHAANIVHIPILLGDILLSNRDTRPLDAQLSDAINVVLIEIDLEGTEVASGPLGQTPGLYNLLGGIKLNELSGHVAVEDGKLAADVGALELAGRATSESGEALGVGEGDKELLGGGAELVRGSDGGGINGDLAGGCGGGCGGGSGLGLVGLGVDRNRGEALGRVDAGGVLEILCVLGDEGTGKFGEGHTELRDNLLTNEVLYGLLGSSIGVVLNLELTSNEKVC